MKLIILLTLALAPFGFSQTLSPKSIELYQTDTLEAHQFSCDHFPFLKMDLSDSENTFLIAVCEYDIQWEDAYGKPNHQTGGKKDDKATPPENIELSFLDLSLTTPDETKLKPVGEFTADLRLNLINDPKYTRVEARENWGAKSVRFGALFIVNKDDRNFTLSFAGLDCQAEVTPEALPRPSSFAKVELIHNELFDSKDLDSSRLQSSVPGAKLKLSTPHGKLLAVKVKVTPTAPNVIGAENRYIFRPSDFMLRTADLTLRPIGFTATSFGLDTIYNISRTNIDDLTKTSEELTLVFAVDKNFQSGDLHFLNDKVLGVNVE